MRDIRVAIVGGAGFMGRAHSLAYDFASTRTDLGFRVIKEILVDSDAEVGQSAARALSWNSYSSNWREAVSDGRIDVIDICTPPHTHAEIAIAAANAGKHVFCEKPIANSTGEADEMAATAKSAGVVNQVGFNYRNSAAIRLARRIVDEGRIGDVLQVRIEYVMDGGWRGDPGWRREKASGGSGALGDIGSHIIDMAQHLAGNVKSVVGTTVAYNPVSGGSHDVDDAGAFLARFDCGAIGTFSYNVRAWGQKNRIVFEIDGTRGALTFDWNRRDELNALFVENDYTYEGFRKIILDGQHEGAWFDLGGIGSGYVEASANQLVSFLSSIVDKQEAHPNFTEAAQVQRVVEAVQKSAAANSWAEVPVAEH